MGEKNIIYQSFTNNFSKSKRKKKFKYLNIKRLISKYPFLNSLNNNYQYSYKKENLLKFENYSEINLIGMGGSVLGTEAIYNFLIHKIKRKFYFFNNLQNYRNLKSKKKRLNIVVSKSGNTLETISNLNLVLNKQKKIAI